MVKQYPHTLSIETVTSGGRDAEGDFITSAPVLTQSECRAEVNDQGRTVIADDGLRLDYSWILYLPLSVAHIPVGVMVEVYSGAELLLTATVKRFSRGQLNARVWL